MSKNLFSLPALLLGAMLMFAPACGDSDPCKDVACGDNGTCFEGSCVCNEGFEQGTSGLCDTESRVKFYGNYNVTETCGGAADSYSSGISAGSDITKVNISNFGNSGLNVSASVDGSNFTVASQTITVNGNSVTVTGTGTISGTTVTLNYAGSGGATFNCVATMTR